MSAEDRFRLVGRFAGLDSWSATEKLSRDCAEDGDRERSRALNTFRECEQRVDEMQQEREGARRYRSCELECKTIDLVIREKDLVTLQKRLETIEAKTEEVLPRYHTVKENYLRIHGTIKEQTQRLGELKRAAQARQSALSELEEALVSCKTQIYKEKLSREHCLEQESLARDELEALTGKEAEIMHMETALGTRLAQVHEALSGVEAEQARINLRLVEIVEQRESALKRRIRGTVFNTTRERDAWIKGELKQLDRCISAAQEQAEGLNAEIEESTGERDRCILRLKASFACT
ncbi:unnamed protein product [Ixodes hexagonus]